MKEIIISETTITTDIPDQLCLIDLTKDVVICTPYSKPTSKETEIYEDILFSVNEFLLFTRTDINLNDLGFYTFFPRVKVSVPDGVVFQMKSTLVGLSVVHENHEKYTGIQVEYDLPLEQRLKIVAVQGTYSIYYKLEYLLQETNRKLFFDYNKLRTSKIPKHTAITSGNFIKTFLGDSIQPHGEIYIIRSDFLYRTFPNFGSPFAEQLCKPMSND